MCPNRYFGVGPSEARQAAHSNTERLFGTKCGLKCFSVVDDIGGRLALKTRNVRPGLQRWLAIAAQYGDQLPADEPHHPPDFAWLSSGLLGAAGGGWVCSLRHCPTRRFRTLSLAYYGAS
jgi:hypothetical protein